MTFGRVRIRVSCSPESHRDGTCTSVCHITREVGKSYTYTWNSFNQSIRLYMNGSFHANLSTFSFALLNTNFTVLRHSMLYLSNPHMPYYVNELALKHKSFFK